MLPAFRGVYRNGRVELLEQPDGVEQAEVIVTFLTGDLLTPADQEQLLKEFLQEMRRGADLGGAPYPRREEIHGERFQPER